MGEIDETAGAIPEDAGAVGAGTDPAAEDQAASDAPPGTILLPGGAVVTLAMAGDSYVIRSGDFVRVEAQGEPA